MGVRMDHIFWGRWAPIKMSGVFDPLETRPSHKSVTTANSVVLRQTVGA